MPTRKVADNLLAGKGNREKLARNPRPKKRMVPEQIYFFKYLGYKNYICLSTHLVSGPKHGSNKYINFLSEFQIFFTSRKRKLHTFTEWNIRFPIQNMNFSVDITKNNGIVPDGHGSNTVFKSGLVAFSDFFRVNYFNILITRFAFFLQRL